MMVSLKDVCERYEESISCVLGNSFIFGGDAEKGEVRDLISEVVDIVTEARGSKRGLSDLLSSETHSRLFASMRVPDWVLLYFKLQARLPDSAWQTLLNLTQLGKSGVSNIIKSIIIIRAVSLERCKTKTKIITLVNHNRRRQSNEPIRTQNKYSSSSHPKCRKMQATTHKWFWFYF